MELYEKVFKILNNELIPQDKYNCLYDINNLIHSTKLKSTKITSCYYSDVLKELYSKKQNIIDDISCYRFYNNIKNNYEYDLHGIYSNQVNSFLDAIFDYNILIKRFKFKIITGNGNVLKPKVIKYLNYYKVQFNIYKGVINVKDFEI